MNRRTHNEPGLPGHSTARRQSDTARPVSGGQQQPPRTGRNPVYITPTGQKVITDVPKLVQKRNQLAMQRMQENIGELQKQLAEQDGK